MLNVGLGKDETNEVAIAGAERHEEVFARSVATRPRPAEFDDAAAAEIARLAAHPKVRAIGETGIDYYRETASPAEQRRAFEAQIEIARDTGCRSSSTPATPTASSDGDRRGLRDPRRAGRRPPGDPPLLLGAPAGRRRDERGWYCSFAGNRHLPEVRRSARSGGEALPDDLLLVETDAPYLAPQPVRGKPERAGERRRDRRVVAEVRGVSYEELERTVEANARAALRLVTDACLWSGSGRTSSPIPTCSTRSSATPPLDPTDVVLEVGAGEGVLTERLAAPPSSAVPLPQIVGQRNSAAEGTCTRSRSIAAWRRRSRRSPPSPTSTCTGATR